MGPRWVLPPEVVEDHSDLDEILEKRFSRTIRRSWICVYRRPWRRAQ